MVAARSGTRWVCGGCGGLAGATCAAGVAAATGGRAITGPTGGRLAIAGAAAAGVTSCTGCLGCGTMRRGATAPETAAGETPAGGKLFPCATGRAGGAAPAGAGGAATAAGRGGALRASASACLRSKIAFSASPGFETWDRSNLGFASAAGLLAAPPPRRFLK